MRNVGNFLVTRKRCPVTIKRDLPTIKHSILYDYGSVIEETGSMCDEDQRRVGTNGNTDSRKILR